MTSRRPATLGRRLRSVYVWHRWLGVAALLFVLLFAATGLALNHTEELRLDERYLRSPLWLQLYGLDSDVAVRGFTVGEHWFSHAQGRLYFNDRYIDTGPAAIDAVRFAEFWALASVSQLRLLSTQGELLETIEAEQLPGRIIGLQRRGKELLLQTPYASFVGNIDDLRWRPTLIAPDSNSVTIETPPAAIVETIRADARSHALNLERLLLDLHSGRLFGLVGVYVMDGAAVVLIILGLSGLWLWLRYLRSQRRIRERRQQKEASQ